MFILAKKQYGKWLLGAIMLALLIWASIFYRSWAVRSRFVERLYTGYEKNVSIIPILAPLEARLHQAMMPDIARSAAIVNPRLWRILKGIDTEDDMVFITGSNWVQAAYIDDYEAIALGANAWKTAVSRILDRPDDSLEACANRLRYWPPALFHFNMAHTFERNFLARVVKRIEKDAGRAQWYSLWDGKGTQVHSAMALYEAGVHFHNLPSSRQWRNAAEKAIIGYLETHQKPDGSIDGNLERSVEVIETVIPPLAMGYRAGIPLSRELAPKIQRLLEILMYSLDMNGCLPFGPPQENNVNKRELLFWGSRIFQRPDFGWVACGGLDALEIRPPQQTNQAFPELGLYVLRNNWEIRRFLHRGFTPEAIPPFSVMSHTMWIDTRRGKIELFAFGERQLRLVLPASVQAPVWRVGKRGIVLQGALDSGKLTVVHLVEADAWILRIEGLASEFGIGVIPLRFPLRETADRAGVVTCPIGPAAGYDWNTGLGVKLFGAVCLRTDGIITMGDAQEFSVRPVANTDSLTIAIMGTPGAVRQDIARAAEDRPVTIAGTDCVIGGNEAQGGQAWHLSLQESGILLDDLEL